MVALDIFVIAAMQAGYFGGSGPLRGRGGLIRIARRRDVLTSVVGKSASLLLLTGLHKFPDRRIIHRDFDRYCSFRGFEPHHQDPHFCNVEDLFRRI
jgi:hypothetical protein